MAPKNNPKTSPEKKLKVQPKSKSVENKAKAHCSTRSSSVYAESHTNSSDSISSDERDEVLPTRSYSFRPRKKTCPESTCRAGLGTKRGCTERAQESQKSCSPVARKKVARKHSSESRGLKRKGLSKATSTKKGKPQRNSTSGDEQKRVRQKKGVNQDEAPDCIKTFEGQFNPGNDLDDSQSSRANSVILCDSDTFSDSSSVICIAELPAEGQNQDPYDVSQVQSNPDKVIRSTSGTNVHCTGEDVGVNFNVINTEDKVTDMECENDDANVVVNNVLEEPVKECSSTSRRSSKNLSNLTTSELHCSTDVFNAKVNTTRDLTQNISNLMTSAPSVSLGSSINTVNTWNDSTQNLFSPTTLARLTEATPLNAASLNVTANTPLNSAVSRVTATTPLNAASSRVTATTPWGMSVLEPHADTSRDVTGGFFFGTGSRLENNTLRAPPQVAPLATNSRTVFEASVHNQGVSDLPKPHSDIQELEDKAINSE